MKRRSAATLVEVLVAIFVTAIGLLALLALFPLGALTMAQAIKDDRTAHAAGNAAAVGESLPQWRTPPPTNAVNGYTAAGVRGDPLLYDPTMPNNGGLSNDTFLTPGSSLTGTAPVQAAPGGGLPPAHADFPGYAIYVDPIGFQAYTAVNLGAASFWVGGGGTVVGIPRRSVSHISSSAGGAPVGRPLNALQRNQLTVSWFTLLDDINFLRDTTPAAAPFVGTPAAPLTRDGRFSWAFMLRRPRSIDRNVVDMSVVVYSQRQVALNTNLGQPLGENAYQTPRPDQLGLGTQYASYYQGLPMGKRGSNVVTLLWTGGAEKPPVRRGSWLLDACIEILIGNPGTNPNGWSHGYFYRVVGVTEPGLTVPGFSSMDVELQTPLREDVYFLPAAYNEPSAVPGLTRSRTGQFIVMENVAEVFEKGPGWLP